MERVLLIDTKTGRLSHRLDAARGHAPKTVADRRVVRNVNGPPFVAASAPQQTRIERSRSMCPMCAAPRIFDIDATEQGELLHCPDCGCTWRPKPIEQAGALLRFPPPYSPDFNPIEFAFAKLKAFLRAARPRTFDQVCS